MSKSTRPVVRIHNLETNEIIDREMNDDEFNQYQLDQEAYAAKLVNDQTKEATKQAILDRIGLTADELKTILG